MTHATSDPHCPPSEPLGAPAQQRVVKVRRDYNRWVATETLEDYALRYTPQRARRWSEWGVVRSRSFRFVVIDEAFGRGSDESARYGLELFKRMNLQLLIVTPLQKIHIIEPYVAGLGFVHSEEGRQSMLRYLTIAQYQAERDARQP